MRIRGESQKRPLRILIDTGSSHNFLSKQVSKKLGCDWVQVVPAVAEVANGQQLQCDKKCKAFSWVMQGIAFNTEVHIIELDAYDLILGVQWLSTLGDISWNFITLHMTFKLHGVEHTIRGEKWALKDKQLNCLTLYSQHMGASDDEELKMSTMMTAVEGTMSMGIERAKTQREELWPALQMVLEQYKEVFQEPKTLPPARLHDHRITLKEGAEPVNIRPYKYAAQQKDVIEELITEMLKAGVIRHSCSPYASPIVLVKKKDATWRMCVDYRALNNLTIKDKYPIPVTEELLDELGNARWFSKIDLRSGY